MDRQQFGNAFGLEDSCLETCDISMAGVTADNANQQCVDPWRPSQKLQFTAGKVTKMSSSGRRG